MEHHVGIDVSLELSSLCVLDATGKVIREAKVASEPETLVAFLRGLGVTIVRSAWRPGRCRSGSTTGCTRRASRRSCSRRVTSRRLFPPWRSRPTGGTHAAVVQRFGEEGVRQMLRTGGRPGAINASSIAPEQQPAVDRVAELTATLIPTALIQDRRPGAFRD